MMKRVLFGVWFASGVSVVALLYACTAAQQKTVLDVVHVSTHVCEYVATLKCNSELLALCKAGHDVSDQLRTAVESDSTCPIAQADGGQ